MQKFFSLSSVSLNNFPISFSGCFSFKIGMNFFLKSFDPKVLPCITLYCRILTCFTVYSLLSPGIKTLSPHVTPYQLVFHSIALELSCIVHDFSSLKPILSASRPFCLRQQSQAILNLSQQKSLRDLIKDTQQVNEEKKKKKPSFEPRSFGIIVPDAPT